MARRRKSEIPSVPDSVTDTYTEVRYFNRLVGKLAAVEDHGLDLARDVRARAATAGSWSERVGIAEAQVEAVFGSGRLALEREHAGRGGWLPPDRQEAAVKAAERHLEVNRG